MRTRTKIAATLAAAGLALATGSGAAHAAPGFGFEPGTTGASLSTLQAGAHPDVRVKFDVARDNTGQPLGSVRESRTRLPAGLVGNVTNFASCSMGDVVRMLNSSDRDLNSQACPREAAVGYMDMTIRYSYVPFGLPYRMRVYRLTTNPGEPPQFGASIMAIPFKLTASLRSDGDYGIDVSGIQLPEPQLLQSLDVTFWGVPADHQGSGPMWDGNPNYDDPGTPPGGRFGGPLAGADRAPLMSNPTSCGSPLSIGMGLRSYADPSTLVQEDLGVGAITGCDQLSFAPGITVAPDSREAGQPSGYRVDLSVPQTNDDDQLATAHLKDAVVTMPVGVALSPTVADGLGACTDAQLATDSRDRESCPLSSKIGTVAIDTPLLDDPMAGSLYVGEQLSGDPQSGQMYRLFMTAAGSGMRIKLRGAIRANPQTGQLTATFADNPQLPFSVLSLRFKGGDRAPLVNPSDCGTYATTGTLDSWGGQSEDVSSSFAIDQRCPSGRFAPSLVSGTANPLAGSFSPFSVTVARTDADRNLSRLNVEMPSGLLAALGSVPLCGDAEANAGSCSAASRIGATTVDVGAGGAPFRLSGQVYVTGPYKGEPFGLSVVVPAKAGPYDLGEVVVRAGLRIDANRAKATAVTEAFPTVVGGVPVTVRAVNVTLDRPGFTFNATSCAQQRVTGGFWSTTGATATAAVGYQAQSCDRLPVRPSLRMQWAGSSQMRKGKHPGLKAQLGDLSGQANLKSVKVTLPLTAALDPGNAKALCEPSAAAARNCPAESIIGSASAATPALHQRVSGPIYFVRGVRVSDTGREIGTLPKLWVPLSGQGVTVDLWADSDVDSKKRLVSTFANVPDVPVRDFRLEIQGGDNGILEATNDVCGASKVTTIEYAGHNGGVTEQRIAMTAPDCRRQILAATNSRNRTLGVRVAGIGPGTLKITGSGIKTATRKVVRSDSALVRASFTKNGRSHLRSGKSIRTRLSVRFKPTTGKASTIRRTVKVKPTKK